MATSGDTKTFAKGILARKEFLGLTPAGAAPLGVGLSRAINKNQVIKPQRSCYQIAQLKLSLSKSASTSDVNGLLNY